VEIPRAITWTRENIMGRASRRKRQNAGDRFRAAMQAEETAERAEAVQELEQIVEQALGAPVGSGKAVIFVLKRLVDSPREQPCLGCGESTRIVHVYRPNETCCRDDLHLAPGTMAAVLYPLCLACSIRCASAGEDTGGEIERRVLAELAALV
jgi:hypothetical protein